MATKQNENMVTCPHCKTRFPVKVRKPAKKKVGLKPFSIKMDGVGLALVITSFGIIIWLLLNS